MMIDQQLMETSALQYRFVRIAGRFGKTIQYISLEENPFFLAWLLFFRGKSLGFPGNGFRRIFSNCRILIRAFVIVLYYRIFVPSSGNLLVLPVPGQVGLKVSSGYKVIDLRKRVVVKLFSSGSDPRKVNNELEWAQRAGSHALAPSVRRWNVMEQWYEEDYVQAYPTAATNWSTFLYALQECFVPLIARIILAFPTREVGVVEYVNRKRECLFGRDSKLSGFELDVAKVVLVESFIDAIVRRVDLEQNRSIFLACSHGDLFAGHVLQTGHGVVTIDWEWAEYRSALFDLYHIFLRRFRDVREVSEMPVQINKAVFQLRSSLTLHAPTGTESLVASLSSETLYRMIYYIDCVCSYAERKPKITARRLEELLRLIETFQRHEAKLDSINSRIL